MKLYCLSGLGADHRVFRELKTPNVELVHIPWLKSEKRESLDNYVIRMMSQINDEDEINLLGLSFGGLIAQEIAKRRKVKTLILVSSLCSVDEVNPILKLVGSLKLYKLIPSFALKSSNKIVEWCFGVKLEKNKDLLKEIAKDSDLKFFRWAQSQILRWKNDRTVPSFRIHGDSDHLISKVNSADYIVDGGGHLAILEQSSEVSEFIMTKLKAY